MMNEVIRYVVKMNNGDYMIQDLDDLVSMRVHIHTRDNPIDADLFRTRENAQRCIDETISGNTNLLVLFDEENPPKEVKELKINFEIS
ncbi:hypothetical protein KDN24_06660 [Bacillus sp. Bva_UNVM-123]|uniref:hypothetical protein n=1 Tax=Bacillus sp. Bva_UNVM-123 TaxID=2829798 RepID=UPI00391FC59C